MKPPATYQKLRGGYYTPQAIGDFLAHWAIRSASDEVLEPSCGDGALVLSAARTLLAHGASPGAVATQIKAIEYDETEAAKAGKRLAELGVRTGSGTIQVDDFFSYAKSMVGALGLFGKSNADSQRFDAVIGNPPFIRYQTFCEEHRQRAFQLMNQLGLHPTRLTNAWVPFVCVASMLLKPEGRLAMVLPAELMQVSYTAELRVFLSQHFCRLMLVTFRRLVFPDIQQEVVLLCAQRNGGKRTGINVVELDGVDALAGHLDQVTDARALKPIDHASEKWTQYFLAKKEISFLRSLRQDTRLTRLGDLASVDVGVVTGLNDYFVLSEEARDKARLNGYTHRIVTRSGHLRGLRFDTADWELLAREQQPAYLLNAPDVPADKLPEAVNSYVVDGHRQGFHKGYKCRIRKRWYIVPSVWEPDAFMLRQVHKYPKIVVNAAKATSTDTIHRVRLLHRTNGERLAVAFINSLSFAFSEVMGRSYGGGVLELEPTEAEALPVPYGGVVHVDFEQVHRLLLADRVEDALEITDKALLADRLGLSTQDIQLLRGAWAKLRDRRLNRKARKPAY